MQIHIKMPHTYSFALTNPGTNYNNLNGREISGLSSSHVFSIKIKDILMCNTPNFYFLFLFFLQQMCQRECEEACKL